MAHIHEFPQITPVPLVEAHGSEIREAAQLAESFYKVGLDQYDDIIIGEQRAKVMYLSLLAMGGQNGMGGILIGEPGGGKSMLLESGHTIVQGINSEHVADVPHRQDLQAQELVGKSTAMRREVTKGGMTSTENLTGVIEPILKPGTKVVKFDEITRTSPLALNAALKIMQDGKIEVDNGEVSQLDLIISGMNNFGTRFTNQLDPAVISRHAMGAFMGERRNGQADEASLMMWDNPNKIYTASQSNAAAISVEDLHKIRAAIPYVPIKRAERDLGLRLQVAMLDTLRENNIAQAGGRLASQLIRIAQTQALFKAHEKVEESDLREAVRYSLTARFGMLGETQQEIDQTADGLMGRLPAAGLIKG